MDNNTNRNNPKNDRDNKNQKKNQKVQEMDEFETSPFFCKHERGYGESEMMEVFKLIYS